MKRFLRLSVSLCAFTGLLLLLVTFTPLVSWLARDMAVDWYDGDADVLVVLGGSMLVEGTGRQATMGYDSYLRCTYASWILQQHRYSYVVVSGAGGLAESMASLLIARGADSKNLLIENGARSTFQNAEFVQKILTRQPGLRRNPSIAVLTSDFHTRRARQVFDHLGMHVRMVPAPDVGKQIHFPDQRWSAFWRLAEEFAKEGYYRLEGRV